MTEREIRLRLNEMGKEVASMFPKTNGSVTFSFCQGDLRGLQKDDKWRPPPKHQPEM